MKILDATCSVRGMWYQKEHPDTIYFDMRNGYFNMRQGRGSGYRKLIVNPNVQGIWQNLPFRNAVFNLIIFDPPFIIREPNIKMGSITKKYGILYKQSWREIIRTAFLELFRVLKDDGTLILKWSETDISKEEILKLALPQKPLFGVNAGTKRTSFWISFIKENNCNGQISDYEKGGCK